MSSLKETIPKERLKLKAKLFRGFADSTRLAILECLRRGEKTVTEIARETGQSQSNVSNHLGCLLDCGLVKNRRDGKNIHYRLRDKKVFEILEGSDILLADVAEGIIQCVRYNE